LSLRLTQIRNKHDHKDQIGERSLSNKNYRSNFSDIQVKYKRSAGLSDSKSHEHILDPNFAKDEKQDQLHFRPEKQEQFRQSLARIHSNSKA
jgi:hypothetical protein